MANVLDCDIIVEGKGVEDYVLDCDIIVGGWQGVVISNSNHEVMLIPLGKLWIK